MFNNVALNVVIGLVFIYLLYSLLTTIMGEWLSSKLGLRQRILRVALERMLTDSQHKPGPGERIRKKQAWWDKFILKSPTGFKDTLAGRFYAAPSVKYLAETSPANKLLFSNTKPSYISPDNFADTLITLLADKGAGTTKMQRVTYCISFNTLNIGPETRKQLNDILTDANDDLIVFRSRLILWYNETMDRATGWYKKKLRMIVFWFSFIVAIGFNVDTIRIAKLLAKDDDARNQLVAMGVSLTRDSTRYPDFIISGKDTLRPQHVIDSGLSRVNKDITAANLILGLGWNFDSAITQRTCMVKGTKELIAKNYPLIIPTLRKNIDSIEKNIADTKDSIRLRRNTLQHQENLANRNKLVTSLTGKNIPTGSNSAVTPDSINTLKMQLLTDSFRLADDTAMLKDLQADIKAANTALIRLSGKQITQIKRVSYHSDHDHVTYLVIDGTGPLPYWSRYKYFFRKFFLDWSWLGCLLTALALSLGAPFWFGVLNKLVQLRSAGPKPEDDNSELNKSDALADVKITFRDIPLPPEKDIDAAVRIFADTISREPGVLQVGPGYLQLNGQVVRCLQVHVLDDATAVAIRIKYGVQEITPGNFIYINVIVTGKTHLMSGDPANKNFGIVNSTRINGIGSFGCVVNDDKLTSDLYLLTCFHVANGDNTWTGEPKEKTMLDAANNPISKDYRRGFNEYHDTAILKINSEVAKHYQQLKKTGTTPREIGFNDVFSTKVFLNGYTTASASGLILHDSWNDDFTYRQQPNDIIMRIKDLILIEKIGDFHDSGSLLVDETGSPVGILLGGNNVHTYAIKMTNILKDFGLQITNQLP